MDLPNLKHGVVVYFGAGISNCLSLVRCFGFGSCELGKSGLGRKQARQMRSRQIQILGYLSEELCWYVRKIILATTVSSARS